MDINLGYFDLYRLVNIHGYTEEINKAEKMCENEL